MSFLRNAGGDLKFYATSGIPIGLGPFPFGPGAGLLRYDDASQQDGTWPRSVTGFAGVKFPIGTGTAATSHFAWLRLRWDNIGLGSPAAPNRLTAIDWAYENVADTPIATGDTGAAAVPEPGTMLLSLLAAGSVGVMAWKRRRSKDSGRAPSPAE